MRLSSRLRISIQHVLFLIPTFRAQLLSVGLHADVDASPPIPPSYMPMVPSGGSIPPPLASFGNGNGYYGAEQPVISPYDVQSQQGYYQQPQIQVYAAPDVSTSYGDPSRLYGGMPYGGYGGYSGYGMQSYPAAGYQGFAAQEMPVPPPPRESPMKKFWRGAAEGMLMSSIGMLG